VVDAGARHLATTGDVDVDQVVAYDLAHAAAGVETARATLEYVRARWAHDRSGRPAVVTDDDVRSLASTAGSEREPIVGRRAPNASRAGVDATLAQTLACPRRCRSLKGAITAQGRMATCIARPGLEPGTPRFQSCGRRSPTAPEVPGIKWVYGPRRQNANAAACGLLPIVREMSGISSPVRASRPTGGVGHRSGWVQPKSGESGRSAGRAWQARR
jgi:hypothetical protein